MFARNSYVEPLERPQCDDDQQRCGHPYCELTPAKTKPDNRRHPERCRRGHSGDETAASQNRPAADEAHSCKDAEWQAHKIHNTEE